MSSTALVPVANPREGELQRTTSDPGNEDFVEKVRRGVQYAAAADKLFLWDQVLGQQEETLTALEKIVSEAETAASEVEDHIREAKRQIGAFSPPRVSTINKVWKEKGSEFVRVFQDELRLYCLALAKAEDHKNADGTE